MQNSLKNPDSKIKKKDSKPTFVVIVVFVGTYSRFGKSTPPLGRAAAPLTITTVTKKRKQSKIQNPKFKNPDSEIETPKTKNKIQNPESKIENPKNQSQNLRF